MIPSPGSKAKTQRLLETADLAIVTGSQDNVRRAYSSGTPAIGVGVGNVPAIVDETADLAAAAARIAQSKCFDNATCVRRRMPCLLSTTCTTTSALPSGTRGAPSCHEHKSRKSSIGSGLTGR